ncbi:MAG: hypothetical protein BA874_02805 [Desulfuromonadales bacterium C00003068]|jgi:uroporphyrin-III C-methyltransferase/precorrin-2 dehydrogenase/sirohydrochlorin ferrochelatase|nr:MAG: hypothetical protein BA874_02805 [Desulfuromonadales bacterium C00003068]
MSTIPILLKNPNILVLGGGAVALQKATVLYRNKIKFSMIALSYCSKFNELDVAKVTKNIEPNDFDNYNIVVDATGCDEVGQLLQEVIRKRYILVNRVDQPDQSNFYFSSLLNYGPLKVAVSTDGASPTIGQNVRNRIEALLPRGLANLVEKTKRQRQQGHIDPSTARDQLLILFSHVYLIECGDIADALVTLQRYPQLSKLSVVLYQHEGAHSTVSMDVCHETIKYLPINCFDYEKSYAVLNTYCKRGMTVGVLIPSGEQFSLHSERLSGSLTNDGVKSEIIVK